MRAKAKVKRHITVLLAALVATSLVCSLTEDVSESLIEATAALLLGKGSRRILLDDSGVPMVDYGYVSGIQIGKQRNPVTISQKGLQYYEDYEKGDESQRQLFLNCADWLVSNSAPHDSFAILEYAFPWPKYNMIPPWRSGLAQGQAIQVLIRAHNITDDKRYSDAAEKLLNSFFVEVENGGVTYKTSSDGWWYEEYADEEGKESRVLNGMMLAVLGIHEYHEYTGDVDAKHLFDQDVLALKKSLSHYDKGRYSYYDILGNPAGKYHKIHIRLLDRLYDLTNEEIFKEYHERWEPPQLPFVVRLILNPTKMGLAIFVGNFFVLLFAFEIIAWTATVIVWAGRRASW